MYVPICLSTSNDKHIIIVGILIVDAFVQFIVASQDKCSLIGESYRSTNY